MALLDLEQFPTDSEHIVAFNIGAVIGRVLGQLDGRKVLTETIRIWSLPADLSGVDPFTQLSSLAFDTGYWHHQIHVNGHPRAYARSVQLGPLPEQWSVRQLFVSQLAQRIDDGISWLDLALADDDSLVRLLVAPTYQLHAFWLLHRSGDSVVVLDKPDSFELSFNERYPADYFLMLLAQHPRADGVIIDL
jgi:hypothetical protein